MNVISRLLLACSALAWVACANAHDPVLQATETVAAKAALAPSPNGTTARDLTLSLLDLKTQLDAAGPAARGPWISNLVQVAHRRHDELMTLIEIDPAEVLRVALPADLRYGMPAQSLPFLEEDADETGELEVIHVDYVDPANNFYIYTLQTSHAAFSLHFADAAPDLATGTTVHVRGKRIGQLTVLAAGDATVQKAVAVLGNTVGAQKTLVILVNFSDAPTQPFSAATASAAVFGTTSNYDYEASYQQTTLTGAVAGWFTIANPSTNCDYNTIASQAKQKATGAGYVLSNYNRLVYAFPSNTCSWWGLGTIGGSPSQAWVHAKYGFTVTVIAHEMGHNLGLYHSHSLDCGTAAIASSGCTSSEYGDIFDVMGNPGKAPHFNAYQKERLGWLNAGVSPPLTTVATTSGTATYSIGAMEDARNTTPRALKIPRGTACSATSEWFYVEARQAKGFDAFLASNANVQGGVLVHKISNGSVDSSFLLDMTPATTSWSDPALVAGQSFTDPLTGLVIAPVSVGTNGALVNVTFPASSCTRAAPKVVATPSGTVWTSAGSTTTYAVTVTNQDSCGCASTTFDVGGSVPTGWGATSARTATVAPGASTSSSVSVSVPSGTPANFYAVSVKGGNTAAPTLTASVPETIAVASMLNVAVAMNSTSFAIPRGQNRTVNATATTTVRSGTSAVAGAAVTVTITDPAGKATTFNGTTGTSGTVSVTYGLRKNQSPTGTYIVSSRATIANTTGSATTSFVLN